MATEFTGPGGERLIFRKTAAETDGELLEMEATYNPNSPRPPLHYHPYQEEQFEVLSGTFRVRINQTENVYETGDSFTVPANTPHWMHNVSEEEGRLRWQIRPAMKSQDFFATMWGLAAEGKTNEDGVPNFLQLAVILREYRHEFRASRPPYALQRVLFALLAPIGRLLGYKPKADR
jgi:quercetin dioxygenase-like cupin family protein